MRLTGNRREGMALAVAIFAMAVIGMLIAGIFFASTQEYRVGRNALLQTRALTAAEYGQNTLISPARWNSAWNTSLAQGQVAVQAFRLGDGSVDTVRVTRLSDRSFLIASEGYTGRTPSTLASRRVGTLLRLQIPQMNIPGALATRGVTKIGGSSEISGRDSLPGGWGCPPAGATKPGIVTPDASRVQPQGACADYSCITGSPPVAQDPVAADTSTYFVYGDLTWDDLKGMARNVGTGTLTGIGPTTSADGSCNRHNYRNWGDPSRNTPAGPCESFFSILYSPGDLNISGGMGQGILLVEGNLDVQGGFEFYGPVIVRGRLKTTGTGGHFNGGVMAANVELEQNTVLGDAVISYSSCAIAKALAGSAMPRVASGRAWVELFR